MKQVICADFNCMDEKNRIWGIEIVDGLCAGQQVILSDGEFVAEATIEQNENGFFVARVYRLLPMEKAVFSVNSQRKLAN